MSIIMITRVTHKIKVKRFAYMHIYHILINFKTIKYYLLSQFYMAIFFSAGTLTQNLYVYLSIGIKPHRHVIKSVIDGLHRRAAVYTVYCTFSLKAGECTPSG